MIRPGRRRRAGPPELDWHLRLAASRRRRLRARRGAWAGLAGAFVGAIWVLAGGPPWATPMLAALGAVTGVALPVRGSEAWARRWIGGRHGLGYDTALEAEGRPDPHGLWAASRDRARLGLRGATPPAAERWWLPPAIAAVLLIAASPWLAMVPRPSAPALDRAATTETTREERDPGDTAPRADGESADPSGQAGAVPPPERPDAVADRAAPPPDARDAPTARDEDDIDGPPTDGDGEPSATGGAAVDRFLRDLEPTPDEATNPFDPAGRRVDEEGSPDARGGGQAAPEDVPPRGGGAGPEAGRGTDASGEGSPSAGAAQEGADPGSEGGPTSGSEGDEAGEEGGASGGGDRAERGEGAGEGTSDGEGAAAPDDARSASEGGRGTPEGQRDEGAEAAARDGRDDADAAGLDPGAGEAGGPGAAGSDGRGGDDAGAPGGEAGGTEPSAEGEPQPFLGGPDGAAERLSGPLGEGAAPSVGSLRGGGQAPASVPEGAPVDPSYGRAAERAADEAGLPGAYREIIRRYFR